MDIFYRAQTKGYSFAEMQAYTSADGGDGLEDVGGICACRSLNELSMNTVMGAMDDDDEIVVFEGRELAELYDGYRVRPLRELARFTVVQAQTMDWIDGNEYE
jgi:hypothetical protein